MHWTIMLGVGKAISGSLVLGMYKYLMFLCCYVHTKQRLYPKFIPHRAINTLTKANWCIESSGTVMGSRSARRHVVAEAKMTGETERDP